MQQKGRVVSPAARHPVRGAAATPKPRSRHFDPPPPQAPPIGVAATLLRHHHQCLDSMGGFCMRRYQHLYP
ncbi:hypothetical protein EYF80_040104 [Liparis tanakae]|uniref:Uncharacterized protein n=1 Tax=Liparis tanakae TaxID=230148 RepID=A0A4Z2G857_9TELE|nr:hypothetical protein EYF80_040104 [Liparis tanakae]